MMNFAWIRSLISIWCCGTVWHSQPVGPRQAFLSRSRCNLDGIASRPLSVDGLIVDMGVRHAFGLVTWRRASVYEPVGALQ